MSERSLILPEDMTIGNIKQCQTLMFELIAKSTVLNIDTENLKHIDSAGVQLLFFMTCEAKRRELTVKWLNCNELITGVNQRLGFDQLLGDQMTDVSTEEC